jgi:hypothetical protein
MSDDVAKWFTEKNARLLFGVSVSFTREKKIVFLFIFFYSFSCSFSCQRRSRVCTKIDASKKVFRIFLLLLFWSVGKEKLSDFTPRDAFWSAPNQIHEIGLWLSSDSLTHLWLRRDMPHMNHSDLKIEAWEKLASDE